MKKAIDGSCLVYCEGAYNTTNGKTAHGLVRFTHRYNVLGVIDSLYAGRDAGEVLDGTPNSIPIFSDIESAFKKLKSAGIKPDFFVIGLAPDGGRIPGYAIADIKKAIRRGMNIDSGLHDFLSENIEINKLARKKNCLIRDIRKTPDRRFLHFFTGAIEKVECLKLAVLGTDSAIGKRTTAWILVNSLRANGLKAEMIGTGQTAWMQGAKYSMIMDSCVNDFVAGEIENAVVSAWENEKPDVIVIEGQGSLMNPAYPGGFEILAAGRPDYVIMQYAPRRLEYDGFPGYKLHPVEEQINAVRVVSGRTTLAITLNHEGMDKSEILRECEKVFEQTGIPCFDVLEYGAGELVNLIKSKLQQNDGH